MCMYIFEEKKYTFFFHLTNIKPTLIPIKFYNKISKMDEMSQNFVLVRLLKIRSSLIFPKNIKCVGTDRNRSKY